MELKELCDQVGLSERDTWHTAKELSRYANFAGKSVSPSTCYSALRGSAIIDHQDRKNIAAAINQSTRMRSKVFPMVTSHDIEWIEPQDTRSWTEKTAEWQQWQNEQFVAGRDGRLRTRDSLSRENRAWIAYANMGGQ